LYDFVHKLLNKPKPSIEPKNQDVKMEDPK